ncbi:hypothetical protein VC1_32 [Vibrio phage Vc1]|uniref:Uncharacterized protein n=1 Tax=Vibrio phage Vc1 TaxID=1480731 RepID=A0A9X9SEW3_9CAUD|nr:hypothetical protein KMB90_gp32 [Vibrio virus 2019VC1]
MYPTKRTGDTKLKIYSKKAFKLAQDIAEIAVKNGSENGMQFDWHSAMVLPAVAYGHHKMNPEDQRWNYYYNEDHEG